MVAITNSANHIELNKNFEKRISAVLPSFVKTLEIKECGMERAGGYGQYKYFLEGALNGEYFKYTKHHTSAPAWDRYQDSEANRFFQNWKKALIITLLQDYIETL